VLITLVTTHNKFHAIIMELNYWIGELQRSALTLNSEGEDNAAELYRFIAKTLDGRVTQLISAHGRPSVAAWKEFKKSRAEEAFPPVDAFRTARLFTLPGTGFVTAGKGTL
jgi:hypothetical protein